MKRFFAFLLCVSCLCVNLSAQTENLPMIEVGRVSTTHILFATDLNYVDISMPQYISAKIVESSKNLLAIKAKEEFDFITTISALEVNGTWHTFKVSFSKFPSTLTIDTRVKNGAVPAGGVINTQVRPSEAPAVSSGRQGVENGGLRSDSLRRRSTVAELKQEVRSAAPTLEEIVRMEQQIFHIGDSQFRVAAYCTNVFVFADLLYLVVKIDNRSNIGFDAGEAQFTVENAVKRKNVLATTKPVWIQSSYGTLSASAKSYSLIGYSIPKLTLHKDECLNIYIYEKSGTRNLVLKLSDADINYAVSPFDVQAKK